MYSLNSSRIACRIGVGLAALSLVSFGTDHACADERTALDLTKLPAAASQPVNFVTDIRPLLAKSCFACHGPEKQEAGLRLDVRKLAMTGSDSGPVILPGKGAESRLLQIVAGLDVEVGRMPPEGEGEAFSTDQVSLLRTWIDAGAQWPDEVAGDTDKPVSNHWSFQKVTPPTLPTVNNDTWVRNPIDAFVLAKLEREAVTPAPEADRLTLLRRVYLDLIGLPPSIEQIESFLKDDRPDAYERCVDQLLESPHYGERWARHWLDLARYADTDGYEQDVERPFAWRYRDWVIDALNRDLSFDKFTVQQLAGDLLQPEDPEYDNRAKVATGFHRNTLLNKEGGVDVEEDRVKRTIDRTNTVSTVWLGMTAGCANCHTHKYDPITQREYFGLYAFFNNLEELDISLRPDAPDELVQAVSEAPSPRETFVHVRGDFLTRGADVSPHTPDVLPQLVPRGDIPDRLDLARWLVADDHPLVARVAVNRLWQQYFGRGIVATSDDFGTQGEQPSHPELLDWLACELRSRGWSVKHIQRLIVTSTTYRQSSVIRSELEQRDPYNSWLASQKRLRVEAEIVRDLTLSASGLLQPVIGGPSVRPLQPEGVSEITYSGRAKWTASEELNRHRRGIYTFFQRTSPYPALIAFDAPEANLTCTRRERSNTPLQALTLLNDAAFTECAQALAIRMMKEGSSAAKTAATVEESRIRYAFRLCLAREPLSSELAILAALLSDAREFALHDAASAVALVGPAEAVDVDVLELAACVAVARAILNIDEFITRE